MPNKFLLYSGLTLGLFFYTFFAKNFPGLSLILLGIFFSLIISEKFLNPNSFFKEIKYFKSRVNRYYRRYVLYTWLSICFFISFASILPEPEKVAEYVAPPAPIIASTPVMLTRPVNEKVQKIEVKNNKNDSYMLTGKVLSNYDGDTITVLIGDTKEKIRLLGIDTAEMAQGHWGIEAKKFTENLTKNKTVQVETDVQKRDKYGRLLGYVYVDGKFLNEELVKNGLAQILTYPPNVLYTDKFVKSQSEARNKKLNIWSDQGLKESPHDFRHKKDGSKIARNTIKKPSFKTTKKALETPIYLVHVNRKTGIYHGPGCRFYNCQNCTLEISSGEAEKQGYRHCQKE